MADLLDLLFKSSCQPLQFGSLSSSQLRFVVRAGHLFPQGSGLGEKDFLIPIECPDLSFQGCTLGCQRIISIAARVVQGQYPPLTSQT